MWEHLSRPWLDGYLAYSMTVWQKVYPMLELFRDTERYLAKFKSAYHSTCCNYDFLGIFKKALRVNHMLVRGYFLVLTEERRKRCLPFLRDDSILSEENEKLMATNQMRGTFPLDELKIPHT